MTMEEMLLKIQSLLYFGGSWHARARGSEVFHSAYSPRLAVCLALGIEDDEL